MVDPPVGRLTNVHESLRLEAAERVEGARVEAEVEIKIVGLLGAKLRGVVDEIL